MIAAPPASRGMSQVSAIRWETGEAARLRGAPGRVIGTGAATREASSRFGEPVPADCTTDGVPCASIRLVIVAGAAVGSASRRSAATPAACGAAIEVPEIVFVAVVEVCQADVMPEPGANTSRQVPQFEKDERASVDVVEPTVIADGARAGDWVQASAFELPAATTKATPSAVPRAIAASSVVEAEPPRLMLATAGWPAWWSATTQSTPAITPEVEPEPVQPSTRTGTIVAPLATPCVVPATVPATCVPWPLQSVVPLPSAIAV